MKRLSVLLLALASGRAAVAQQPDTVLYRLRPVEVTVLRGISADLRTAAAVTLIGRSSIQDGQLTVGLDEALAIVPGVVVNNRYNFALGTRIAIRGLGSRAAFGVRGVRLLVDGVPLTMPDGQANVNNLDLGSAGRIEVLRGPASSLYGNAAGGVVAVETEAPPPSKLGGELRLLAGDLGRDGLDRLLKGQVKLGGQTDRADYLLSLSRLETDGFRAHSRAEQTALNTRFRWMPSSATRWTALLNYADSPTAQNPGALPLDSVRNQPTMAWPANVRTVSGEAASQLQGGVAFERTGVGSMLRFSAYGLTRSLENPLPFGYITLDRNGGGARALYQREAGLAGRRASISVGADLELQSDERGEFDNASGRPGTQQRRDQTDGVTSIGPFAQAQLAISPRFDLTAGIRYDLVRFSTDDRFLTDGRDDSGERSLSALSPRAAVLFALNDHSSLYGSISTAFQTPTTTELLNRPPAAGDTIVPGGFNPDLEPQRALNFEIGWKGTAAERFRYELVVYQMNVKDALAPFQLPQVPAREFFRNSGETRHRGLELALTALIANGVVLETAYTLADYNFIDDGDAAAANEGKQLPGVPPSHLFARLRVTPIRGLILEVEDEYTDRYYTNDANTAANASANIIDARARLELSWRGTTLRPFVALNNLTDQTYNSSVVINAAGARYYEPAPGRNLYFGVAIGFGGW